MIVWITNIYLNASIHLTWDPSLLTTNNTALRIPTNLYYKQWILQLLKNIKRSKTRSHIIAMMQMVLPIFVKIHLAH